MPGTGSVCAMGSRDPRDRPVAPTRLLAGANPHCPRDGPWWGCSQGSASPSAPWVPQARAGAGSSTLPLACLPPSPAWSRPHSNLHSEGGGGGRGSLQGAQPDTPSSPETSSQQLMSGEKGADVRSELVASSLCLFLLTPHHHRDELCLEKAGMGLGCCREAPSLWAACLFPGPQHA